MNELAVDSLAWSPRRLGAVIAIAVAAQLALILWFSARGELKPRTPDVRPDVKLMAGAGWEWLAMTDPTVFSRAHPDGFSGVAWLSIPPHSYLPADRGGAPMWLAPAPKRMGAAFQSFVKGYLPEGVTLRTWQPPMITPPSRLPAVPSFDSRLKVLGPLAVRGIVTQPELPAWTNTDILAPSQVQVLVDARGHPVSVVLLRGSGLEAADQSAVAIAQRMSFGPDRGVLNNPASSADDGLTTGSLVFSWRTLAPATNGFVNPR